jgi:hypothetical protein
MRDDLRALMGSHEVQPVPIYKDGEYVQPTAANGTLKDSLVEVHFAMRHFRIQRRDSKPFDSFTGILKQVIILKPGQHHSQDKYKRKNCLEGPYRPKPFFTPIMLPLPSAAAASIATPATVEVDSSLLLPPASVQPPTLHTVSLATPTVTPATVEDNSSFLPPPPCVQPSTPHTVSSLPKAPIAIAAAVPVSTVAFHASPSVPLSPFVDPPLPAMATIATAVTASGVTLATPALNQASNAGTSSHDGNPLAVNLPQATTRPTRKQAPANKHKP